jgi:hypothetical protein
MDPKFIEFLREQYNPSIGMAYSDVLGEEAEPDPEQIEAHMERGSHGSQMNAAKSGRMEPSSTIAAARKQTGRCVQGGNL